MKEYSEHARKIGGKMAQDLESRLYGSFASTSLEHDEGLTIDKLAQAYEQLKATSGPSVEIRITKHVAEKDDKGPLFMVLDNRVLSPMFRYGPDRTVVMHPAAFAGIEPQIPSGIPVYGYDEFTAWRAEQAIEKLMALSPAIPARVPYLILTVILLVIVVMAS